MRVRLSPSIASPGIVRLGRRAMRHLAVLFAVLLIGIAGARTAAAQPSPGRGTLADRYSAIVIDAASGRVLSELAADTPRYPASLTKMMTLFMLFEALRDHRVTLNQLVPVSAHAASMEPSKLGLVPGTRITVEQAILGLVTKSANDAAAAIGELLGGDEARFAQMMTLRARALGMSRTSFRNASGLPDPEQVTTARDLATLARHLIQDFPDQYSYFSVPSFQFRGRTIFNHDRMLQSYPGADGLKTGYITASGHNLATSAVRDNVRLIGVVLGARSNGERDIDMRRQLDDGFVQMGVGPVVAAAPARSHGLIARAEAATVSGHGGLPPTPVLAVPPPAPPGWAVQLGAYATEAAARRAAGLVRHEGGEVRVEMAQMKGRKLWRGLLVGLHRHEAISICAVQAGHHAPCMVVPPAQMAAR